MLAIHYHYLMFAYNQISDFENAIIMAKTYLTFHPNNEHMQNNLLLLEKELPESSSKLKSEPRALKFYAQAQKEVAMLEYLEKYLNFEFDFAIKNPFPGEFHPLSQEKIKRYKN